MVPTIKWEGDSVYLIDQRKLPQTKEWFVCHSIDDVIAAIRDMAIRGAPAIGIAAGMGLALGSQSVNTNDYIIFRKEFLEMTRRMKSTRPTASNVGWAVDRMAKIVDEMRNHEVSAIKEAVRRESEIMLERDIEANRNIGQNGMRLVPDEANILTHCNAGALATGGYGTALGIIRAAFEAGKQIHVYVDETRPLLQGMRLTSFELMEDGIPVTVIVDCAAGYLMQKKRIDLVITGADRIALNGDTANKIGTYQLAVLAKENEIPFYVAAPISSFDPDLENGDRIPIEERGHEEVVSLAGQQIGPDHVRAYNPAFDVTPCQYISAIITEKGVVTPPYGNSIKSLFKGPET
ncbi:MAG: S-methyl-5-thioribose-1-phosphate isomerase [Deltaproteobacteria bacterium]|nr:MAG: S-methyl-5-thioribose-1-phosphate isomerase [Deltaproteobacteria bacterium]